MIVFITLITSIALAGTRFSFGVFFKPIASEFDLSRAATSSLFSVFMIFCAIFTTVGGWALDKYGPKTVFFVMGLFTGLSLLLTSQTNSLWQLYLSYSLLLSIGTGAFYPVINATVSRWFEKKRGLALGIASTGARLGLISFAPFSAFLISHFGWRISYMIIGLVTWLLVLPASRLMRKDPGEIGALPDSTQSKINLHEETDKKDVTRLTGSSLSQALRTRSYWLFSPAWLLIGFANALVYTHIVPYATDMNISTMEAATVISVIGFLGIPSGILVGRISDNIGVKKPFITILLFRFVAFVWLIWAHELWMLYIFAIIFGFSVGGTGVCIASISVDIFGRRSIGVIMGTLDVAFAIGSAIGPFIGGLVFDASNSYTTAFLIAAIGNMIIILLIALLKMGAKPERVESFLS